MEKRITGALAIGGTVYRAGQESEMEAAAKAHKVDLTDGSASFAHVLQGYASAPKAEGSKAEGSKAPKK